MTSEHRTWAELTGTRQRSASWLHFWRFVTHPNRLASIIPSSETLSRLVADQVRRSEGEFVVELGAGTGAVTRAVLASGVPAGKLVAVEIDGQMARFLRSTCPDVAVVEGNALDAKRILPPSVIGRVGTVICGIPASLLPLDKERELAAAIVSLMPAGRRFLAYSYRLASPLPARKIGLVGKRLAFTFRNFPPASVWGYVPEASIAEQGQERSWSPGGRDRKV
jgi:phosphatidylethanolamine/phosphatidyl-N-methylethanolamine N-methyltransferase